jgi:hypothetical protein
MVSPLWIATLVSISLLAMVGFSGFCPDCFIIGSLKISINTKPQEISRGLNDKLMPVSIIWMELVTRGLFVTSLVTDPVSAGMESPTLIEAS